MGGSKKKEDGPPLNAGSKDEENFIKYDEFTPITDFPSQDLKR